MGRKKAAGVSRPSSTRRKEDGKSKYEQLTVLNDQLLKASSHTPLTKDLEGSCQAISEIVEQIRVIQGTTENPSEEHGSREGKLRRFISWCVDNGAKSDKVELALFYGYGVGVRATQRIQHEEMFLSIPNSLMMNVDVEASSIGRLLKTDPIASRMPNIGLALYLLNERFNKTSSWKPYIDALPDRYDTPLYFSPTEISLLKGSPTYEQSISMQRNIARQYAYFWVLFRDKPDKYPGMAKHFNYDLYRWAVSTVMTRQNILPQSTGAGASNCPLLIPLWDMCNHKQGKMLTDYDVEAKEIHCYAMESCEPGDQVFICYSTRPNSDFLVHNGFVYRDNPNNSLQLRLGLAKTDASIEMKRALLTRYLTNGVEFKEFNDSQVFYLNKESENLISRDLLIFLRVFNASEEELKTLLDSSEEKQSDDSVRPISEENEKKCWTFLKVRCTLLLRAYSANLEDAELLASLDPHHVSMVRLQLNGEKEILREVIRSCDSMISGQQ